MKGQNLWKLAMGLWVFALLGVCTGKLFAQALLEDLPPSRTGVDFVNRLEETECRSLFHSEYLYNGAGVAVGDFNEDGLPDLFFVSNFEENRLYLNEGNFHFRDFTRKAGVAGPKGWNNGVACADINGDGHLDLYINRTAPFELSQASENLLFLGNGKGKFREAAAEFNLNDPGNSHQTYFFDAEGDGDLDALILNHPTHRSLEGIVPLCENSTKSLKRNPRGGLRFLQNQQNQTFLDLTDSVGLGGNGYALSAAFSDFNQDKLPDIYVAVDYDERDLLFISQPNGTWKEEIRERTKHISQYSMGSDAADINRDGLMDIFTADMVAGNHYKTKANMGSMNPQQFWGTVKRGQHYQYMTNALQLNTGNGQFSDIGQMLGLNRTDWTWSTLFADIDHNGFPDLLVTNGIRREIRSSDVTKQFREIHQLQQQGIDTLLNPEKLLAQFPVDQPANLAFSNQNGWNFELRENWGFAEQGWSHGLVYADLDQDGDLDLVVNNLNKPAKIYQNHATEQFPDRHWIQIQPPPGMNGQGLRISLETDQGKWTEELWTQRGYLSSSQALTHIGLGNSKIINRLTCSWPDGTMEMYCFLPADTILTLSHTNNFCALGGRPGLIMDPVIRNISDPGYLGIDFVHEENEFDDYEKQILLPRKLSQEGPCIAVGDLNGDGKDDFFVGGASSQTGGMFIQEENKHFRRQKGPWESHPEIEETAACIFDADQDGKMDLYIAAGGNEWVDGSPNYRHRLFLNNGKGKFVESSHRLPNLLMPTSFVKAADFDGDGWQDLLIGGRHIPGQYPLSPPSYLLHNEFGDFVDLTDSLCPDLAKAGMLKDGAWADLNQDSRLDFVVLGEWTEVQIFYQEAENRFRKQAIPGTGGLWNCLLPLDFDEDGDLDLLCGNLGTNHKYHVSPEHPLTLLASDFDGQGGPELILTEFEEETAFPVRGRSCSSQQLPQLKAKFPTYEEFARADVFEIYGTEALEDALELTAPELSSCWFKNEGDGAWARQNLPQQAQIAPVNGILPFQFTNHSGQPKTGILLAGNDYAPEIETVRYDAGVGLIIFPGEDGEARIQMPPGPDLRLDRDVKTIVPIVIGGRKMFLVGNNDGELQLGVFPEE